MQRKYEFTGETKEHQGRTLHRIRRPLDGELGGWIESEDNLSHEGRCWVAGEAKVYGKAWVGGDAQVGGYAQVSGNAWVGGSAWVGGNAQVSGNAWVDGDAQVYGNAQVGETARVLGHARVYGDTWLSGKVRYTEHYSTAPTTLTGPNWDVVQHPSGLVSIGCEKCPLGYWLENYRDIGSKHRLTEDEVEEYGKLLHSLQAT